MGPTTAINGEIPKILLFCVGRPNFIALVRVFP